MIGEKLGFIRKLPVWAGVVDLESYLSEGFSYSIPHLIEQLNKLSSTPVKTAWVAPEVLQGLLNRVRLQARSRLGDNIPRKSSERKAQTSNDKLTELQLNSNQSPERSDEIIQTDKPKGEESSLYIWFKNNPWLAILISFITFGGFARIIPLDRKGQALSV